MYFIIECDNIAIQLKWLTDRLSDKTNLKPKYWPNYQYIINTDIY